MKLMNEMMTKKIIAIAMKRSNRRANLRKSENGMKTSENAVPMAIPRKTITHKANAAAPKYCLLYDMKEKYVIKMQNPTIPIFMPMISI